MNHAAVRLALCASPFLIVPAFADDLTQFESPPVHPIEMSASRNYLFVTHTADHRLVIFDLSTSPPKRIGDVFMAVPSPTSSESRLGIHLDQAGTVSLAIYDVRGALVRRLINGVHRASGTTVESWDLRTDAGTTVSSGVYFARLEAPGTVLTRRVTVVR